MIWSGVVIGAKRDWKPQLLLFLKVGICAKSSEQCMLSADLSLEEQLEKMGWKPYNKTNGVSGIETAGIPGKALALLIN